MSNLDLTMGGPNRAEAILPVLAWDETLKFLADPEDIQKAGEACTLFKRLLRSKLIAVNLGKTLPLLMNYLDGKSILNCRSVCKGWLDAVDNLFENYFLKRSTDGLAPFPLTSGSNALYCFDNLSELTNSDHERFIREMKDHPRNPFIGRAVHFSYQTPWDRGLQDFVDDNSNFQSLYDFLNVFGKHIWTFQFGILDTEGFYRAFEFILPFLMRDLFVLAPNLKRFIIKELATSPLEEIDLNEMNALAPPPGLVSLEMSGGNIFLVDDALIQRCSNTHLNTLCVQGVECLTDTTWPYLKELHITHLDYQINLNILQTLRAPKLEMLSLTRSCSNSSETEFPIKSLEILIGFLPCLKRVRISNNFLWKKNSNEVAEFPDQQCHEFIKTLEIQEESGSVADYSFLRCFPHVENIHIIKCKRRIFSRVFEEIRGSETIELHKFMYCGRMYKSNIWNALPALKTFSFGKKVYTRSGYERRCRSVE